MHLPSWLIGIGTVTVTITALTIAYGIYLKHTPPPKINPKDIPTNNGRKYIITSDKHIVEYYVYGSSNPNAKVILEIAGGASVAKFFPDYPGLNDLYKKLNIKAIAITLPGWGYSSLNPARKYVNYPKTDIQPILSAENVTGKFAVYGISLGAPHAMSIAYYYGSDRVPIIGVRVPFLDMKISKEYKLPKGQPSFPTAAVCGKGVWYSWAIHLLMYILTKMLSSKWCIKLFMPNKLVKEYPVVTDATLNNLQEHSVVYGYHGIMQCMAYDTICEWGFDVRDIDVKKWIIWYAKDDDDCPPSHGKWLAEYFADKASVRVLDGYGHVGGAVVDHLTFVERLINNNQS
eukprot:147817_1